jgi:hypothetical protein
MQLPRPVAQGGGAAGGGARYNVVARSRTEDGRVVARVPARGVPWLARRIVIQGPSGSICRLYTGNPSDASLADGSQAGALDVADYYQPLYVEPGTELVAVWLDTTEQPIPGEGMIRVELEELG